MFFMFYVLCFMFYVFCFMFYVLCFMFYVLCFMFYVFCFLFFVFFDFWCFLLEGQNRAKIEGLVSVFFFELLYLKKRRVKSTGQKKKQTGQDNQQGRCCMHSARGAAEADLRTVIAEPKVAEPKVAEPKSPKPEGRRPPGLLSPPGLWSPPGL